jgi:predicted aspartyl protease
LKHQRSNCKRTGHLERQCDHIRNHRSNIKHSKVSLTQIGTVRQSPKSNGLMKMEINVNSVQIQFYLDTGAEVNIISKETFDYISALTLQKCDEVACMYNGQTATFLCKGRAVL